MMLQRRCCRLDARKREKELWWTLEAAGLMNVHAENSSIVVVKNSDYLSIAMYSSMVYCAVIPNHCFEKDGVNTVAGKFNGCRP